MNTETWKVVKGYEEYLISTKGNIKSLKFGREKNLIPGKSKHKYSYYVVTFSLKGKTKTLLLHRLIGETFIPNPDNKKEINHKNGNKLDNSLENLEWCSHRENAIHARESGLTPRGTNAKINREKADEIRDRYKQGGIFLKELAKEYGISTPTVCQIISNKIWI